MIRFSTAKTVPSQVWIPIAVDPNLMASIAYSTWKSLPSGEKVFTLRSYSLLVKNMLTVQKKISFKIILWFWYDSAIPTCKQKKIKSGKVVVIKSVSKVLPSGVFLLCKNQYLVNQTQISHLCQRKKCILKSKSWYFEIDY